MMKTGDKNLDCRGGKAYICRKVLESQAHEFIAIVFRAVSHCVSGGSRPFHSRPACLGVRQFVLLGIG